MRKALLICALGMWGGISVAQDIHFAQFDKAPLHINPGLCGMGKGFNRANINYRQQWNNLDKAFTTMAASFDMPIISSQMTFSSAYFGVGFDFYNDQAGLAKLTTNHFGFTLSGIVELDLKHTMSLGFQTAFEQKTVSPDALTWDNQWTGQVHDPSLPSGEQFANLNHTYFDFSTGLAWKYVEKNIGVSAFDKLAAEAGVAYFHVNKQNSTFYSFEGDRRYGKFVMHAKGTFGLKDQYIVIHPSAFFAHQGPHNELIVGSVFKYLFRSDTKYTGFENEKGIGIGFHVRGKDAIIPTFVFETKGFEFGINYDYTVSPLQKANNGVGGFEVSLIWQDTYGRLFGQGDKHVKYVD